jgi:phosphoglycerate dehydrogenase-like enzyme
LGYGAIGREVAHRALAFGMEVLAYRRTAQSSGNAGVRAVQSLPELLSQVDHLVLALPATPATRHILNAEALSHARKGLHLINIARGSLIDQEALRAALDSGLVAAATLDVTEPEPLPEGHWLYSHPAVRLTPHISWAAGDVASQTAAKFVQQLQRYLGGEPLNDLVDPLLGY